MQKDTKLITITIPDDIKGLFIKYADIYFGMMKGSIGIDHDKEYSEMRSQLINGISNKFSISEELHSRWFSIVFIYAFESTRELTKIDAKRLNELHISMFKTESLHCKYNMDKYFNQ